MIPKFVPPLTSLTILVTRPSTQADPLCTQIEAYGGTALRFPTIAIEPIEAPPADAFDVAVFVSVNAVTHGKHLIPPDCSARIAAIGKATAAALTQAQIRVDCVPNANFTSEALLAHPELKLAEASRALIVRGVGGRELLQQTFAARGLHVQIREVYRRVRPPSDDAARAAVELHWREMGIDVVTLTSVTTLQNLLEMLSETGRTLLKSTPVLVVSERIAQAARDAGLLGEIIVAPGADEASIAGTLARWCTRARV